MVAGCIQYAQEQEPHREPLISSSLPDYPWQTVRSDLFELQGVHYLLTVDYFSQFPEAVKLTSTTAPAVIQVMKGIVSRYGIPETVRSDNGFQYSSHEFGKFADTYSFDHITSSPLFPQSNGLAECLVKT